MAPSTAKILNSLPGCYKNLLDPMYNLIGSLPLFLKHFCYRCHNAGGNPLFRQAWLLSASRSLSYEMAISIETVISSKFAMMILRIFLLSNERNLVLIPCLNIQSFLLLVMHSKLFKFPSKIQVLHNTFSPGIMSR